MFFRLLFTLTLSATIMADHTAQPSQPTQINGTNTVTGKQTISKNNLNLLSCGLSAATFATALYAGLQNPNYQPQCFVAMFCAACTFGYSAYQYATTAPMNNQHNTNTKVNS